MDDSALFPSINSNVALTSRKVLKINGINKDLDTVMCEEMSDNLGDHFTSQISESITHNMIKSEDKRAELEERDENLK